MILVYLGRWSYGRFQDDNNIFYKMKNDLNTGTWQDDIWCPIIIISFCTSDEHLLRFLDKYVSHAVGNHYFLQWSKSNRSKTFLDKVTASGITYTILVFENTKEVWEEELQIKARYKNDEERNNATHHEKTQVSCRKGEATQKVWRWLDRQWTRLIPRFAHDLQGTQVKWCMEYTSRSLEIVSKETLRQRW